MNPIRYAVHHRLPVNLVAIFVLVAGIVTFFKLNREAFPLFSFDIVVVTTAYPGATPEEVEKLITRPIERELKSVSDLKKVESVSTEGLSYILVEIDPDASNKSTVVTDIQQAVARVPDFPIDLEDDPLVREIRTQDTPILEVALSGPLDRQQLQDTAEELQKMIEDLELVSSVEQSGFQEQEIWIELSLAKLVAHKVSIDEVVRAVRARNINIPGGVIDTGFNEYLIRTNAEFYQPADIAKVVVRANTSGNVIRVQDLGTVRWSFKDAQQIMRVNGDPAVKLVVVKKARGDTINLVSDVSKVIETFKPRANPNIDYNIVNDVSIYVRNRLNILLNNGWIGLILVLIALFLFLSRSVAFWTAMGLPVAMAMVLWIMGLFDISINLISMFGLIIILGILVDDSIVVAESIFRYMDEEGLAPHEAAIRGTMDVAKPVLVTVLTTVVFFLPLAFMSGIFGKFVRPIPIVVIVTLLASLVECLLILPSHLGDFGKPSRRLSGSPSKPKFQLFAGFQCLYVKVISLLMRWHVVVTVLSTIGLFAGIYLGLKVVPLQLFPSRGIEIFFVRFEASIGTSLEETARRMHDVEAVIGQLDPQELEDYVAVAGISQQDVNDPGTVRGSHVGQIVVYLTPFKDRKRKANEIMEDIRSQFPAITGFERIWIDEVNPGPPQEKAILIRVRGPDYTISSEIARRIYDDLVKIPGVLDLRNDYEPGKQELQIQVDDVNVARAGLTPVDVAQTVRSAFDGTIATVIRDGENETNVLVRLLGRDRETPDTIAKLFVRNPLGFHVPMANLAKVSWGQGVSSIKHFDYKRAISISGNIDNRVTTSVAVNQQLKAKYDNITKEFFGYDVQFAGEDQDTQESLASLKRAALLALLMAFVILATAFNSLSQPFLVLMAIPYGLLAALVALHVHGEPLSFLAFLGLIGLSGVAVNDAVIVIDQINRRRKDMSSRSEAIVQACRTRLRPVILTSITTVFGLAPVAYGIGGFDPFLRPMALVISWGLVLSTVLTLILVPTAYATMDALLMVLRRRQSKLFLAVVATLSLLAGLSAYLYLPFIGVDAVERIFVPWSSVHAIIAVCVGALTFVVSVFAALIWLIDSRKR